MKSNIDKVIASIYSSPDDWRDDGTVLKHKDGCEIWTGNGQGWVEVYRPKVAISRKDKKRLWKAYENWCQNTPILDIKGKV